MGEVSGGVVEWEVEVDGGAGAVPASRRPNVMMPDEYLPPNKILFLQNLPENVTKDQLMALFSQYVEISILLFLVTQQQT